MAEMEVYRQRCRIVQELPGFDELDIDFVDEERPIAVGNFVDIDRHPYQPVGADAFDNVPNGTQRVHHPVGEE